MSNNQEQGNKEQSNVVGKTLIFSKGSCFPVPDEKIPMPKKPTDKKSENNSK